MTFDAKITDCISLNQIIEDYRHSQLVIRAHSIVLEATYGVHVNPPEYSRESMMRLSKPPSHVPFRHRVAKYKSKRSCRACGH